MKLSNVYMSRKMTTLLFCSHLFLLSGILHRLLLYSVLFCFSYAHSSYILFNAILFVCSYFKQSYFFTVLIFLAFLVYTILFYTILIWNVSQCGFINWVESKSVIWICYLNIKSKSRPQKRSLLNLWHHFLSDSWGLKLLYNIRFQSNALAHRLS